MFVGGGGGGVSSGAKELVDLCGQVKEKGGRTALVRVSSPKDPDVAYVSMKNRTNYSGTSL